MKLIFAIFALCFLSINAHSIEQTAVNYENMIDNLLKEMALIAKDAGVTLKQQIEEIVFDPLQQVEAAVVSIDKLREENETCVAAQENNVTLTVDIMHKNMSSCGRVAANSSAEIMTDISAATHQLIFGGYDVIKLKRKCDSYTHAWMKDPCLARLSLKAALYLNNARKSIKTIKQSTSESIPAVMVEADSCTHKASETAILELKNINGTITDCISKTKTFL